MDKNLQQFNRAGCLVEVAPREQLGKFKSKATCSLAFQVFYASIFFSC